MIFHQARAIRRSKCSKNISISRFFLSGFISTANVFVFGGIAVTPAIRLVKKPRFDVIDTVATTLLRCPIVAMRLTEISFTRYFKMHFPCFISDKMYAYFSQKLSFPNDSRVKRKSCTMEIYQILDKKLISSFARAREKRETNATIEWQRCV